MSIKKVVVFGATGFTGLHVLNSALEAGMTVRAFVRDPARLPEDVRGRVEAVQGDVLNLEDVQRGVEGQEAVIVTLGTRNDLAPTTAMSEGMKNIITAMNKAALKPVAVCISAFLFFDPTKVPPRFLPVTEDHRRMSDALKGSSDIDWIAVYPPHIADIPSSNGAYAVSHETEPSSTFRGRSVSVRDLAHFLVHSLNKPEHYKQICGIAT